MIQNGTQEMEFDIYKEGNGGKVKSMGNSCYFIVRKVVLLGVSDHCVKKPNVRPVHMNIYFKISMDRIIKSYEIQIPPIGCS